MLHRRHPGPTSVEPILVRIAGKPRIELFAGRYFYCGSANGPGGLRSRLARHMRRGKSVHWHIDQLTERGSVTGAWIVRNGRECDLVAMLAPLPMPIPGFGSSDCSRCLSHLLDLPFGGGTDRTPFGEITRCRHYAAGTRSDLRCSDGRHIGTGRAVRAFSSGFCCCD